MEPKEGDQSGSRQGFRLRRLQLVSQLVSHFVSKSRLTDTEAQLEAQKS